VTGTSEGAGDSDSRASHIAIFEAYKLDGTFLWRVKSGPNIIAGNSINFAVADLDGDGCAEMVTKTGEGTVFGDGSEIPDTDGDGKTDYRDVWPAGHYTGDGPKGYGGPEFFSDIDGRTGKELARANFICRGKEGETPAELAANWYQNDWKWDPREKKYQWKLANSLRLGVASFTGTGLQIFLGRGVYGRTVVEGWEFSRTPDTEKGLSCSLTRLWKLDTDTPGGADKNKDGKPNSAYAGQGNHAFNVADLDGDGLDEVMYGSCAWDNDGTGLWTTGLGHGDANHVGRFLPGREGMQVFHCLENGKTQIALHDAKDGSVIWKKDGTSDNDMGRCMTADVDPSSPGYEFWMYGNELFDQNGNELYTDGARRKESSANAGIWFDGYLNRQMIDGNIINSYSHGRTFTMYRYDVSFNNSTKSNPGWYGDFLGDWREEVIVPDQTKLKNLKIFSTWYPTQYKLPYLMSDHTYYMQTIHEQVGYNQPTNIGSYYLGSDMDFSLVPLGDPAINGVKTIAFGTHQDNRIYDLSGRMVQHPKAGIYVRNGRKYIVR
jgi:rhamnogalacturonan endolyase